MSTNIGTCKHNHPLHFGFPCAECEAEVVVEHICDEMRAGWKTENGLVERMERLVATAITDCVERVRRYEKKS